MVINDLMDVVSAAFGLVAACYSGLPFVNSTKVSLILDADASDLIPLELKFVKEA
jgi:hypothetical protein